MIRPPAWLRRSLFALLYLLACLAIGQWAVRVWYGGHPLEALVIAFLCSSVAYASLSLIARCPAWGPPGSPVRAYKVVRRDDRGRRTSVIAPLGDAPALSPGSGGRRRRWK